MNVLSFFKLFLLAALLLPLQLKSNTLNYRLSLRDDPSTSVVIGWEQDGGSNPMVYYGTTDLGQNWASYPLSHGVDRSVTASGMDNKFARLTGLTPNTAYYFVIKDSDGVSNRFWFKTTPMGNSEPISVIAGGDSRAYLDDSPREAANLMVAKLRPDLVLFGGDYTWLSTDYEWGQWMDDWQLTITSDGKMVPVMWERGNHELSAGIVYDLFDLPSASSDEYYAISVGGDFIRFYTLNTEISIAGNQTTWLQSDLQANYNNHDWNIVQYHTCMRPHTTEKSNGDAQYNAWAQLFHDYRVQLVVESDAHDVKTTWPVKPSTGPNSEDGFELDTIKGTVYIGEGCWGAPLRSNDWNKNWTRNSGSFNSFHWLKIGKDTIEVRTVLTDNAASVGSVTDADKFTPPAGINIWNPSNGNVVYITNQKYIDRPEVDVTYPFHQQFFSQPQAVTITADAFDINGGNVQEVKFYINDVYIGSDLTAPYEYNWTIPTDGDYVITAWAIDNDGWHNVSDEVHVYAGEIDITASLLTNDDDAEQYKSDGSVDLTSSDLELCVEEWPWPLSDEAQWVGLRFNGLEIPNGATITSAYVQFTADEDQSGTANLVIYGEASDNAAAFTSSTNNLSNRTRTTTSVSWSPNSWSTDQNGTNEQTPDITNIVSEIINRSGWDMGNALVILIEGSGTRSGYSRDTDVSKSAKLHITFTYETPVSNDITENVEEEILVYPNPTSDLINIKTTEQNAQLSLFDINGKLVYQSTISNNHTLSTQSIGLTKGIYFVRVNDTTKKIIIQ
ncbi:MAG: T9SS type A sorting domain-containing protein [Flavobacteriales bacterium]|nr:T9SS type A sorting domain-containing protein [Flavobacteriales bacterium]